MKLGAQLFTLRDYMQNEKDIRYSLKKVAEIGYKYIQLSGVAEIKKETFKEICDDLGLSVVLTHTSADRILYDTENVIKEHDIFGCKYIGLGAMHSKYRSSEWLPRFYDDFKEPAKKIAAAGKLFMYHNHDFEFEKINGKRIMDWLISDFSENEMGITLDTYWVQAAGADICDWVKKLANRIPCVHLKDYDMHNGKPVMAPVMEGNINFKKILELMEKLGTVEYLLVEQDTCLTDPFECLRTSYNNLTSLGYR